MSLIEDVRQNIRGLVWRYVADNRHLEPTADDLLQVVMAYAAEQIAEERKACMKAVCQGCREDIPLFQDGEYIGHSWASKGVLNCDATAIRRRSEG